MRGDVVSNVLLIHVALYPWKGLEVDSEMLRMRAHMSTNRAQLLKIARIRSKYSNTNICLRKKAYVADGISGFFGTRALSRNKHSRHWAPQQRVPRDIPLIGLFQGLFRLVDSPS
jgi:hypothetical protein